jgi:Lon protease-like protein
MPLALHVFETRYKQMINECLQAPRPFGVVLIKSGQEALGPLAEPYPIGCAAEIAQVQPLAGGRMNVFAVGKERFRIVTLRRDLPYLVGMVEDMPLLVDAGSGNLRVSTRLVSWVREYLALLSTAGEVEFDGEQLPSDPQTLVYLAATLLQIPNQRKQELLAAAGTLELVQLMNALYRQELPLLRLLLQEAERVPAGPGSFSLS